MPHMNCLSIHASDQRKDLCFQKLSSISSPKSYTSSSFPTLHASSSSAFSSIADCESEQLPLSAQFVSCESLIPGLPDDLAFFCLLRLPLASQAVGRAVCKAWHTVLSSWDFYQARRGLGFTEQWLFVLAFHKSTGKIQWQALDPAIPSWHVISPMPCTGRVCPPGFGCAAIADEGALFVCGGMRSDMDCPMDSVLKYEMYRNKWTVVESMSTPRSFFASGMIDGRIYAAGGNSNESFELSSAEVYDPTEDHWYAIANMGTKMARYDAAVFDGKLYVTEGWSWPFLYSPRGQIYDPKVDRWEDMTVGMREGWTGLSVVLDGLLFIISDLEDNVKLKVYEADSDSWKSVAGAPMPAQMSRPFSVNTMHGKLFVVARSLHVAMGTISNPSPEQRERIISVDWQVINAPERFSDFAPSNSQVLHA
ncbi:hypothetical protein O6H91_16G094900 [Diphasiastrum complanatum]|uniref:Uncharacterized protein n=14 Tax=Diphasiastrum complanatum TaxID=34168 RepID=A0ACC2BEV1_DIPCM|nr:hypothetical protein O6H91_16G094900 [Diphasiastrum complanatum]KAJ7528327.1 hypothetical protein O6H91_16G094900 [Diphasiastrum complanatum]KAJ7528328.1 hypothetical protein O6H91_16G094900 [Diphasiastrum complanatum]KAJ7528329.1 hypothetical protein O6H91_16G094900 [Diphasiastrum complanatum]KAJ7528330.1 hypothetical protein O6H91_16G094900 [Diphasiastrum complanatum]